MFVLLVLLLLILPIKSSEVCIPHIIEEEGESYTKFSCIPLFDNNNSSNNNNDKPLSSLLILICLTYLSSVLYIIDEALNLKSEILSFIISMVIIRTVHPTILLSFAVLFLYYEKYYNKNESVV